MCGICGVATGDAESPVEMAMLQRMNEIIRHRGPDGEGYYQAAGVGLGVRRLSIIDLETGDQPIFNENKQAVVICNGEIYNYPELRAELQKRGHVFRTGSDVEVIVHLYEEYGTACLDRLRGMFAFALWDAKKRILLLARDRLGIKPLHYAVDTDGTIYFSSELKSILTACRLDLSVDPSSLRDLFTFGFVRSPKTLFQRIKKVDAGHFIIFRQGQLWMKQYWDLSFASRNRERISRSDADWVELLRDKMTEAIRIHLRSDVPVGAWLSAGIDSSSVVALMKQELSTCFRTYTLAFDNRPEVDEVANQRTLDAFPSFELCNRRVICRDSHFSLFPKVLWHLETPTTSAVHILQFVLAEESAKRLKVVLTGEGADENLGGYPWYLKDKIFRPLSALPRFLRSILLSLPTPPRWKQGLRHHLQAPGHVGMERFAVLSGFYDRNLFDRIVSQKVKGCEDQSEYPDGSFAYPADFNQWRRFEQLQYVDTKTRLEALITHGLDRASMAHSVEARVPFLDHELVEFCAGIPRHLKMRFHREKYILRRAMRGFLPDEILARKKRGLSAPVQAWLRNGDTDFIREMLSGRMIREKGYFNPDSVNQLMDLHRQGQFDYYRPLMAVLGVQLWDELFVRGRHP